MSVAEAKQAEAIALGFESDEKAIEHQEWLREHGTLEFKNWLAAIEQERDREVGRMLEGGGK